MRTTYAVIAGALFLVILLSAGCGGKSTPDRVQLQRQQVSGVSLQPVVVSEVDEFLEASGTVRARTTSIIASRMMGTVTSLRVKEGDRVKSGQLLLAVDDRDVAQKVKAAEEGHHEALKALEAAAEQKRIAALTYQRYKRLYDDRAVTGQEFDQIEMQKKVAEIDYDRAAATARRIAAGLEEARVFLGYTRAVSPVNGVVTEKKIDAGSMAVPGMPLLTVEDTSAYRVEVNLDEKAGSKVRPGMSVSVFLETLNREVQGSITEVVPAVDPATRTFMVKIGLPGDGLKSGMYGKVRIPAGKRKGLLVPNQSLAVKGQLTGVYVVDPGGIIAYRLVRAGKAHGDKVEILSGLRGDERIIVSGVAQAVDGGVVAPEPAVPQQ